MSKADLNTLVYGCRLGNETPLLRDKEVSKTTFRAEEGFAGFVLYRPLLAW